MTGVALIPDAERLTGAYLRAHPDVAALATRVVSRTPANTAGAWVRVSLLDATAALSRPDHLVEFLMQLDVYAPDVPTVWQHARTIRAALTDMPGVHADGVVARVAFTGMARIPDTDFEPARERVVLDTLIHAHP